MRCIRLSVDISMARGGLPRIMKLLLAEGEDDPTESVHITAVTQLWCEIFGDEPAWLDTRVCVTCFAILWLALKGEGVSSSAATTLDAAAGLAQRQKWGLILPSSAKVSKLTFAETGSKAVDFDIMCKALGVNIDVSSMRQGTVLIDNTEARKKELVEFIEKVVSTKKLSSVDALKLRGRMQFTAGQLFGRVAKTCLARVTNHAYRSSTSEASDALISSLVLFKKFLLAQKPRAVTAAMLQTWLVFTDASFEQETEDIDKAGFGGVLVSPQGKYVKFFSFELRGEDLAHLNPFGKKTAIFQCEFFAVLIALELWGELLSSRQVVFYVDNDGVRDVLISCNTSNPVGSVLLTKVLEKESACAISSWFTRVPSKSNVADDPSRGEIDQLIAAQAKLEQVEPVRY